MTVRCLIFLLLIPAVSFPQQPYYGTRVSGLTLSGTSVDSDLQFIPLRVGDTITPDNVREAIQFLYNTGRYHHIEVDATSEGAGTHLTFSVRPYYYFSTFRLEPEYLLDRTLSGFFRLPVGEKFSETVADRIAADTVRLLINEGYIDAKVVPEIQLDSTTRLATVVLKADVQSKAVVSRIDITGGEEVFDRKELADAFGLQRGHKFSSQQYDAGLRRIRDKFVNLPAGAFLNTRIDVSRSDHADTNTVDFTLKIDPGLFTLVEVAGYEIGQKKLKALVPMYEEGSVDPDLVEEGRSKLRAFLQQEGYFEAEVRSEVIPAPLDNAVQINYTVDKGARHRIAAVRIEGQTFFTEEQIKARMKVRAGGFLDSGLFSPELLDQDVKSIHGLYRSAGFEGTQINPEPNEREHEIEIVISIDEGRRFPIEIISFHGNVQVSGEEILERSGLRANQIYTPVDLENARNALTSMYYAKGFPDARIDAAAERLETNRGVQVTFRIVEGERYTIGRILVAGNTLTKDKIIHRNSNLYPNTPYNPEALLESQQRLYATGLFTRVDIVPLQQDLPSVRNVLIHVEDGKPILLTPSFGVKEGEGPRATFEVAHNNLFGLDRSISLRARGSLRGNKPGQLLLQATYKEPKLFNHDLEGFASVFAERSHQKQYDASRVDFSLQALRRLSATESILALASYQTVNPRDFRINPRAEQFPEGGIIQIARVGGSYVRDRRDDAINPNKGSFETTSLQIASRALRSEVNFTSFFNQSNFYRPLGSAVLASSVRFGWNQPFGETRQLPITERYFAGGSTTLRGFAQDEAGPEAGGNTMAIGNVEYRLPLPVLRIKELGVAFFYDGGNVFARINDVKFRDLTHTGGAGLRYNTPLGPVRFDMGINLHPRVRPGGQKEERVHFFFTLGHTF